MNFNPTIAQPLAIFMALLAPAMWGSWFICLKYLKGYPIEAFYVTLFVASMVIVWGLGFALDGSALIQNIIDVWNENHTKIILTFACGILYVAGMQLSLRVYTILGLTLTQPIQSSISVVVGTIVTSLVGGIPAGLTITRIIVSAALILAALLLCFYAGNLRNKAQREQKVDTGLSKDPKEIRLAIIMMIAASLFTPAYSLGLSYGLKSITQPSGMAVMPFMAVLCTGAFVGAMLTAYLPLVIRGEQKVFFQYGWKTHSLGIIAGICHYGGNIIHTFATSHLSTVVSWPLGLTGGLWTQMWGLKFGEFKGAPKKAFWLLGIGILCYLLGSFTISNII